MNVKSKGVLPVAILSSDSFDASEIDVSTLELFPVIDSFGSAAPIRASIADVGDPELGCDEPGLDGLYDLEIKFNTDDIVKILGPVLDGQEVELCVQGETVSAKSFEACDSVLTHQEQGQVDLLGEKLVPDGPLPVPCVRFARGVPKPPTRHRC